MVSIKVCISHGFEMKAFAQEFVPILLFAENRIIGILGFNSLSSLHISVPNFPGRHISNKIRSG